MFIRVKQAIKDAIGPTHPGHLIRWYHSVPWVGSRCRGAAKVLDAGCGDGGAVMYLAARHPEAQFVGADIQAPEFNRSRATARGLQNVQFERCDLSRECPGGPFDTIFSVDVLEHVENPQGMLRLLARELRPGGQLMIHVPCETQRNVLPSTAALDRQISEEVEHRHDGFAVADLETMLLNAGLKVVKTRTTFGRGGAGLAWEVSTLAQRHARFGNELGALLKPYVLAAAFIDIHFGGAAHGRGVLVVAERLAK